MRCALLFQLEYYLFSCLAFDCMSEFLKREYHGLGLMMGLVCLMSNLAFRLDAINNIKLPKVSFYSIQALYNQ